LDPLFAAAAIAGLGAVGIGLLWNLDLLVYHRLLDAAFYTGYEIEKSHPELPPLRIHMLRSTGSGGVIRHVLLFYIGGIDVLVAAATLFASFGLHARAPAWLWLSAAIPMVAMMIVVAVFMVRVTNGYTSRLRALFQPEDGRGMQRWSVTTSAWSDP
jgi:hypothetical protein